MKLKDLTRSDMLERPAASRKTVADGAYDGNTMSAELLERESKFSGDGTRVVLNIKVEVLDEEGEKVELYVSPNLSWSKRGNMIKILEGLGALPEPGESLRLADLVGIPVRVMVENVDKDGETYSNIIRIKRTDKTPAKAANTGGGRASRRRQPPEGLLVQNADGLDGDMEDFD